MLRFTPDSAPLVHILDSVSPLALQRTGRVRAAVRPGWGRRLPVPALSLRSRYSAAIRSARAGWSAGSLCISPFFMIIANRVRSAMIAMSLSGSPSTSSRSAR
jgi:hypothetical protein